LNERYKLHHRRLKAWKLFRQRKDGSIGSLFINRRYRIPIGEWLRAESHPTKGYKHRPFWHCTKRPLAPHLSEKGRVWRKVEVSGVTEISRPESQGGVWYLARCLRVFPY